MAEEEQMAQVKFADGKKFGIWQIIKSLNEGEFGQVYLVENSQKEQAVLKAKSNAIEGGTAIKIETLILKQLNKNGPRPHIPVIYRAMKRNKYCYFVMELFGNNLHDLMKAHPNNRFSRGTWSRLGIQCLYGIKYIHDCGFIHRDIKPQHFVMGNKMNEKRFRMVHILDFGLARPYAIYNDKEKRWRPRRGTAEPRGTLRYMSPNVHRMMEQGRVDDVWSLIFVLVEFNGGLPWQSEKDRGKIEEMKLTMNAKDVMKDMPTCLSEVIPHLDRLNLFDRPDYRMIFKSLWQVLVDEKVNPRTPYDFETTDAQIEIAKNETAADWENSIGTFFMTYPISYDRPEAANIMHPEANDEEKSYRSDSTQSISKREETDD